MDLDFLITIKGIDIRLEEKTLRYFKIAEFPNINLGYGIYKGGWVIEDCGDVIVVNKSKNNYLAFMKVLQIPIHDMIKKIEETIVNSSPNEKVSSFFPIIEVTKTALKMESSYWSELCLDFLIESLSYNKNLIQVFDQTIDQKWVTQSLKHKMLKYTSRTKIHKF